MKKILAAVTFFVFSITCIPAQAEDLRNEIRVQLPTSSQLDSLYMGKIQLQNTPLPKDYLEELENVFHLDLGYSGLMKLLKTDPEKEALLAQKEHKNAFSVETWRNLGALHVIKSTLVDRVFSVSVLSVRTGSLKQFPEISLSGNLSEDRRLIHKLSDAIVKALFNVEGITSQRVLYSAQVKSPKTNGKEWSSEIWECDWDGANAKQVTKEGSYCVTPVFMPARNDRFLYVSYKLGQPKIYIASLKEGVGHRFIDIRGNQLLPAVSLQRDKIAFISDAAGRADLFIQPFHPEKGELGKPIQLFSYPRSTQASPTFSPDGSKLAFVSDKDGSPRIYTISTKVSGKRNQPLLITKQNTESSCPSWSPDGKKLAYSAKTKGTRQIWIYDFEAEEEAQLTYGPGNKENPSWASDSLHLVFNSTDANSCELYVINLNQPEAIKISRGSGKKHYPTWGRRL